jgi:hypothetical protein
MLSNVALANLIVQAPIPVKLRVNESQSKEAFRMNEASTKTMSND